MADEKESVPGMRHAFGNKRRCVRGRTNERCTVDLRLVRAPRTLCSAMAVPSKGWYEKKREVLSLTGYGSL